MPHSLPRDPHVPSFPSGFVPGAEAISPPEKLFGQRLFDDTTEFYSWYVSAWYMSDKGTASAEILQKSESTRKILSLLKRIAEVSMSGGGFLTEKEEANALNELSTIIHDLSSGNLRKQDLPGALFSILENLTQNNPKAKVVAQTTELEYLLCINPPPEQSSEMTDQCQRLFTQIIQGITPEMRDINASAIAQGLSQILENPHAIENMPQAIHEAIKHWV